MKISSLFFHNKKDFVPPTTYQYEHMEELINKLLEKHGINNPEYGTIFDRIRFEMPHMEFAVNGEMPLIFKKLNGNIVGTVDIKQAIENKSDADLCATVEKFLLDHVVEMLSEPPMMVSGMINKWSIKNYKDTTDVSLLSNKVLDLVDYPRVGDVFNVHIYTDQLSNAPKITFIPKDDRLLGMENVEFQPHKSCKMEQTDVSNMARIAIEKAVDFVKQKQLENIFYEQ